MSTSVLPIFQVAPWKTYRNTPYFSASTHNARFFLYFSLSKLSYNYYYLLWYLQLPHQISLILCNLSSKMMQQRLVELDTTAAGDPGMAWWWQGWRWYRAHDSTLVTRVWCTYTILFRFFALCLSKSNHWHHTIQYWILKQHNFFNTC